MFFLTQCLGFARSSATNIHKKCQNFLEAFEQLQFEEKENFFKDGECASFHNVLPYFKNYALSAKSILPCTLIMYGVYERIFGGKHSN